MTRATRTRFSPTVLAGIARDLRRAGDHGNPAWYGVIRQVRRYADELRGLVRSQRAAQ